MLWIILLIVINILIFAPLVRLRNKNKYMVSLFEKGNVIVFGRKGKGKDLIFNYVIHKRKKSYLSNISYGEKGKIEPITTLELGNNTYESFINDEIVKQTRDETKEGVDYYISDAGVFLPSQYTTLLDKKYKSLPIYYALSRHLYNSNIHANTQALSRLWNKLREQADSYIQACDTKNFGIFLITKYRIYDKYTTAEQEQRPIKYNILSNKLKRNKIEELESLNGQIIEGYIIQLKRNITYNTRHFKDVVFDNDPKPTKAV